MACLLFSQTQALENGLARTPPMGWMHWQRFRCITNCTLYPDDCISDRLFRTMADLMVTEGYLKAGYEYLTIDDCWLAHERDSEGRLQPDPDRFPYGMKDLADYIHSKGLKFGLYEDYGTKTCEGYPGSLGYLEIDAQTFADWGVDYVKLDGCNSKLIDMPKGYTDFGKYLNQTGRPIVYSCSMAAYFEFKNIPANYRLLSQICNLWRNWEDIQDSYASLKRIVDWYSWRQYRIAKWAGPGHWNDPDMLIIGNFGLSYEQSKTQMALWAILAAPLLMSNDLRTIRPEYKELLLHKEIISINQDKLGIQGRRVRIMQKIDIFTRPISPVENGFYSYAIAFYSKRDDGYPYAIKLTLRKIGLKNVKGYVVSDVFDNESETKTLQIDEEFVVKVKPSGVVLLKAIPIAS